MPVTFSSPGTAATLAFPSSWQWQAWSSGAMTTSSSGNLAVIPSVTAASTMAGFVQVCTDAGTAYPPASWTMPPDMTLNRAEIDRLRAEHRRDRNQCRQQRIRAQARAEELLASLLTPEQAGSYREHGWFAVRGSAGGWWRIRNQGQAGNVEELDGAGHPVATWCCHPPGFLPDPDAHAAQYLHLVTDEPGFRKTGNRRPHPAARLAA
jgi:hypothetical protein